MWRSHVLLSSFNRLMHRTCLGRIKDKWLCTWCKEGRKKTYRLEKKETTEAPDFVHRIHPCKLQLFFDILLLISTSTEILQALGNLHKLFGVGIMVSVYSTWQKGAPTHKVGCWALPKCQAPRCRVAICEDLKEPFLLPLINYRENKGFHCLLPTSLLWQSSKKSAPEQRKLPVLVQPQCTPSVTEKQEKGASSSSEGTCSFVHLFTDLLHCSGHGTGC